MAVGKQDYPPLLPEGFHAYTLPEIYDFGVARFGLSETRKNICDGLARLSDILENGGVPCDVWVNGSFMTEKYDPEDADLLVRVDCQFLENASPDQHSVLEWINKFGPLEDGLLCHTFVDVVYPPGTPIGETSKQQFGYWQSMFGLSRGNNEKGIAVLKINGGLR